MPPKQHNNKNLNPNTQITGTKRPRDSSNPTSNLNPTKRQKTDNTVNKIPPPPPKVAGFPDFIQTTLAKASTFIRVNCEKRQKYQQQLLNLDAKDDNGKYTSDILSVRLNANVLSNADDRHNGSLAMIQPLQEKIIEELKASYVNLLDKNLTLLSVDAHKLPLGQIEERVKRHRDFLAEFPMEAELPFDEIALIEKVKQHLNQRVAIEKEKLFAQTAVSLDLSYFEIEGRVETSGEGGPQTEQTREGEREEKGRGEEGGQETDRIQEGHEREGEAVGGPEALGPMDQTGSRTVSRERRSRLPTAIPAVSIPTAPPPPLPAKLLLPPVNTSVRNKSFMTTEFDPKHVVPNFKILTTKALPQRIIKILNKGYKYMPELPSNPKELKTAFDDIIDTIDATSTRHSLEVNDLRSAKRELRELASIYLQASPNLSSGDDKFLEEYLKTHNLIVRNADKNLGFFVADLAWYEKEMTKHLGDREYYALVESFPKDEIVADLNTILRDTDALTIPESKRLELLSNARIHPIDSIPAIYLVAKIHKVPISTRPVVPEQKAIIMLTSKYLDTILLPMVKECEWILRSTLDLIDRLETTPIGMKDPIIMSADVVSLYTNLNTKQGVAFIINIMKSKDRYSAGFIRTIGRLLTWVFKNNYFTHRETLFQQTRGGAMGTSCMPNFANLVLSKIEMDKILPNAWNLPQFLYSRLIDDTFMVIERENVREWKEIFQSANNYLTFTFDTDEDDSSVPMLDLETFRGPKLSTTGFIDFTGYKKPYNNNLYTAPDSHVPDNYKFSWITGENIRLIRNNDNEISYLSQLEKYVEALLKRGYCSTVVSKHINHAYRDRDVLKTPRERVPFNLKVLRIPNIPGYEQLIRAAKVYIDLTDSILTTPPFAPIVLRGRNLEDIANSSTRDILRQPAIDSDMAPSNSSKFREDGSSTRSQ
jgi:hypothetical protein